MKKELILTIFYLLCLLCGQSEVFAAYENSDKQNVRKVQQSSHYRSNFQIAKQDQTVLGTLEKEVNKKTERTPDAFRTQKKSDESTSNVESTEHRLLKQGIVYSQERQKQVPEGQQVRAPLSSDSPSSPVSSSAISTVVESSSVVKATQEVDKPLTKSSSSKMPVVVDSKDNISKQLLLRKAPL